MRIKIDSIVHFGNSAVKFRVARDSGFRGSGTLGFQVQGYIVVV